MYLLIENPGVAAAESFTLLGASNKAGSDAIGQFGSGTKFGVLALLREGLSPTIYCGNLKLEFGTKDIVFDGCEQKQVFVKLSGKVHDGSSSVGKTVNRTQDLSLVLRYGEIDWKDSRLALREFVSNALDAVKGDHTQVRVEIVAEPRAKAGTTRVFVPLTDAGRDFVTNLSQWFLHWSDKPWRTCPVLDKAAQGPARIYRRGVFVREITRHNSLFDYNLDHLPLDEARVADDWSVAYYAARAVRLNPRSTTFARILALGNDDNVWEQDFNLSDEYDSQEHKAKQAEAWQSAAEHALGDKVVLAEQTTDTTLAEGKGYKIKRVPYRVAQAAKQFGLRTPDKILTADEREGRRIDREAHPAALVVVTNVWAQLQQFGLTRGEQYPQVFTYEEHISGGSRTLGFYRDNGVYINRCLLSATETSPELFAVALEEIGHHITKATDNSRDFQEFFIQALTKILY